MILPLLPGVFGLPGGGDAFPRRVVEPDDGRGGARRAGACGATPVEDADPEPVQGERVTDRATDNASTDDECVVRRVSHWCSSRWVWRPTIRIVRAGCSRSAPRAELH